MFCGESVPSEGMFKEMNPFQAASISVALIGILLVLGLGLSGIGYELRRIADALERDRKP